MPIPAFAPPDKELASTANIVAAVEALEPSEFDGVVLAVPDEDSAVGAAVITLKPFTCIPKTMVGPEVSCTVVVCDPQGPEGVVDW
ncbi:MAG: hypothetical protein CL912_31045 [Deltaproteobacteria bacterium]|nr:hypothetical protein [Deltaproteobacteria bacterium]